jgi:porin
MPVRTSRTTVAALLGAGLLITQTAAAEDACCRANVSNEKQDAAFAALTGDWGGFRSTLKQNGVEISSDYTAEIFGNPKGGRTRSAVFDGLFRLSLDVDLEKTVGWHDAAFRISGLYAHGTSGSLRNVGDAALFSNIDAYDSVRLMEFWIEQKLMDGKASVRFGQLLVDAEFGVTETAALFINSSTGIPSPPITPMPYANYPAAGLGVRLKVEPVKGLYGMVGLYDGNPSTGDFADPSTSGATAGSTRRNGTDWALRASEGVFSASEVGYQHSEGPFPGAYRIGFLYHSDDFADVRDGYTSTTHTGSSSGYYVIDQTLWQKSEGSKEGVAAFLRGTMADEKTSFMADTLQMGLVYTGVLSSQDKLGFAFVRSKFSPGQVTNIEGQDYRLSRESIAELTYLIPLKPYLRVQPDFQYISRPAGTSAYNNAWVLGVRATVDF